jgi:(hydroxyamino)benzene mutase
MTAIFLAKAGLWLFLFGLLVGVAIPKFTNPRMGLSAHLTAVQSGAVLLAIAAFWPWLIKESEAALLIGHSLWLSFWLLVIGQTLSAAWGASKALPMAGAGHSASALKENVVSILVYGSSVVLIIAVLALAIIGSF